jgi:small-conductance mechanosensitive channel
MLVLLGNAPAPARSNDPSLPRHAAAPFADERMPPAQALFARQPLGFDLQTWGKLLAPAHTPTAFFAQAAAVIEEERHQLGGMGVCLLGLCALALGGAFVTRRRLATTVHRWTDVLAAHVPLPYRPILAATGRMAVVAFPPVLCLVLFLGVQALTEQEGPVLRFATQLLLLWMGATVLTHLARAVFLSPLVPAPHGAALLQCVRLLMSYAVCGLALLWGGTVLHLPPDMLALVRFLLIVLTASSVFLLWSRQAAILALFPPVPNRLYQRFLTTLSVAYQPLLVLTFTTGLLWALGYQNLASFLWQRSWALAAVFLAAVFLHHVALRWMRQWLLPDPSPAEATLAFHQTLVLTVTVAIAGAGVLCALALIGLLATLLPLLAAPLVTVGTTSLSVLLLLQTTVIIATFLLGSRLVRTYLDSQIYPALDLDLGVAAAINTFLGYALGTVGLLLGLRTLGLDLQALTIFAGALGIGAGFGLQSLISDIASGLTLVFGRTLRRGDFVKIGEVEGFIQEVGVRSTRLRTTDDIEILTPNSQLVSHTITNYTHTSPLVRLHVPVGVSYRADPERVKDVLLEVAQHCPRVHTHPAPDVWFVTFGENALLFELLVWINNRRVTAGEVKSALYFELFRALKAADIEIPFPQHDIHIRSGMVWEPRLSQHSAAPGEEGRRETTD